jgi:hypothetical protein
MPYLGNPPAEAYTTTVKDSFSGDGSTTAFTLSVPSTTNDLRVVVENVIQDPTVAYSVSGTTLTFTSAPPTGTNNIYAVNLGPAVQTVTPPAEIGIATNFTDGITVDKNGGTVITADRASSDGTIIDLQRSGTSVGSLISTNSGTNIAIDGASGKSGLEFATSVILPFQNGVRADNAVSFGNPSYRFSNIYLSSGVYLGGTGSSNYLDDYEEGTWTPSLAGSSGTPSHTINSRSGYYRKIGDLVFVSMSWDASNISGGSGDFYFTGLPFTDANLTGGRGSAQYYQVGGYNPAAAIYGGNAIGGIVNVSAVNSTWRWGVTSDLSGIRSIISYNMFYVAS